MRQRTVWRRLGLACGLLSTLLIFPITLLAEIVKFEEKIPFYESYLIGYERDGEWWAKRRCSVEVPLETSKNIVAIEPAPKQLTERKQLAAKGLTEVDVMLEITSYFNYYPGMFRELTLIDENGKIYQWTGLLTFAFGVPLQIDVEEARKRKPLIEYEVKGLNQAFNIPITFHVPTSSKEIRLRLKDKEWVLFSNKK